MRTESINKKPEMEDFGWYSKSGFDDDESGWMFEGGEDAYYEALEKWKKLNKNYEDTDNKQNHSR